MPSPLSDRLLPDRDTRPNSFTKAMGKLIKSAREQSGLSQGELAKLISRRQASLSDIENGKMEVDATTLAYLAAALRKPIGYFFPLRIRGQLEPEDLSPELRELLIQAQRLTLADLKGIIAQVRALADLHNSRRGATRQDAD